LQIRAHLPKFKTTKEGNIDVSLLLFLNQVMELELVGFVGLDKKCYALLK
jgi:hypothetical protein